MVSTERRLPLLSSWWQFASRANISAELSPHSLLTALTTSTVCNPFVSPWKEAMANGFLRSLSFFSSKLTSRTTHKSPLATPAGNFVLFTLTTSHTPLSKNVLLAKTMEF